MLIPTFFWTKHSFLMCLIICVQKIGKTEEAIQDWRQLDNEIMKECLNNKKCVDRLISSEKHHSRIGLFDRTPPLDDIFQVKRYQNTRNRDDYTDDAIASYYETAKSPTCSCVFNFTLIDLGQNYYPRYVRKAICKSQACWSSLHQCKPKSYLMYFLRRRDESVEDIAETFGQQIHSGPLVPEQLRKEWMFEGIPIDVSCECLP